MVYKEECYLDSKNKLGYVFKINLKTLKFITLLGKTGCTRQNPSLEIVEKEFEESQHRTSFYEILNKDTDSSGNKLRAYAKIKNNYRYVMELYMQYNFPPSIKRSIAQIRLGSHDRDRKGKKNAPRTYTRL